MDAIDNVLSLIKEIYMKLSEHALNDAYAGGKLKQ